MTCTVTAWKKWKTCVKLAMDDMHCVIAWKKWKTCVKLATEVSATVEPLMKSSLEKRGGNMMFFCVCVCIFLIIFFNVHMCTLKLSCLPDCLISISPKFWQIITYTGLLSFYLRHCLKHKSEDLSVSPEFGQIFTCISPKTLIFYIVWYIKVK